MRRFLEANNYVEPGNLTTDTSDDIQDSRRYKRREVPRCGSGRSISNLVQSSGYGCQQSSQRRILTYVPPYEGHESPLSITQRRQTTPCRRALPMFKLANDQRQAKGHQFGDTASPSPLFSSSTFSSHNSFFLLPPSFRLHHPAGPAPLLQRLGAAHSHPPSPDCLFFACFLPSVLEPLFFSFPSSTTSPLFICSTFPPPLSFSILAPSHCHHYGLLFHSCLFLHLLLLLLLLRSLLFLFPKAIANEIRSKP